MRRYQLAAQRPVWTVIAALAVACGASGANAAGVLELVSAPGKRAIEVLTTHGQHSGEHYHLVYDTGWKHAGIPGGEKALKTRLVQTALSLRFLKGLARARINTMQQAPLAGLADLVDHNDYPCVGWTPAFLNTSNGKLQLHYGTENHPQNRTGVIANLAPTDGFTRMMTDIKVALDLRRERFKVGVDLMNTGAELVQQAYSGQQGQPPEGRPKRLTWAAQTLGLKMKGTPHGQTEAFLTAMSLEAVRTLGVRIPDPGGIGRLKITRDQVKQNVNLRDELAAVAMILRHLARVDAVLPKPNALVTIFKSLEALPAIATPPGT